MLNQQLLSCVFTQLLCFQLGDFIALPGDVSGSVPTFLFPNAASQLVSKSRLQDNEVAAVEPPPVVLYSPDSNSGAFQPESPVQPEPHPPAHHKPPDPYSQHPTHPDTRYHPDPRYPAPTDPRYPSYTDRGNQPDGRATQDWPTYQRYPLTTPQRPPVPETPVHRHTSGPGVHRSPFHSDFQLTEK